MKAQEANFLTLLKNTPQFTVPIYQRRYEWEQEECKELWADIKQAGENDQISSHFMGAIVYVRPGNFVAGDPSPLIVIDGQQRLTTCSILLAALYHHIKECPDAVTIGDFKKDRIKYNYLIHREEEEEGGGDQQYRLIPSDHDRDAYLSIICEKSIVLDDVSEGKKTLRNYLLFRDLLMANKDGLDIICRGLQKLWVVELVLDSDKENPQLVFESLNSTGKELGQVDLIRNYILMGLTPNKQARLYKDYWEPIERGFGKNYNAYFDPFMRHYLTAKTFSIPNQAAVYKEFKKYVAINNIQTEELLADIKKYSRYYNILINPRSNSVPRPLGEALQDLKELKVDVAYPLLMNVLKDRDESLISGDDVVTIIRMIESYVFRRAICDLPTNSLNKIFISLNKDIDPDNYVESLTAALLLLPSYRRFPNSEEFVSYLKNRDLYNFRSKFYWLRKIENIDRQELVDPNNYTVEHIMPQNLSAEWRSELGPECERIQQKWLHTLGNLTLTQYNGSYSDNSFMKKRDYEKDGVEIGLGRSPLFLNAGLGGLAKWTETTIIERADRLSLMALRAWQIPELDAGTIGKYKKSKSERTDQYKISDYKYLTGNQMRDLFEALSCEILGIDSAVTQHILQMYIAYKLETNFADVEPQAKALKVFLNMPFSDIDDPGHICRDVSNIGTRGNGEVSFTISSHDDIPYAMTLIRQSFDHQIS
jgi:uncharacterized protein with ParB-like and HNH nuclease domain/predicted transport protein